MLLAQKLKRIPSRDIWTSSIGFYFDGASWTRKTNPCDQARTTTAMAWHKKSDGSGGKMVKVFVAIAYGHGVVLCEQYEEQLTGQIFEDFVREYFENAFENSSNPRGKLSLQDGDPS